MDPRQEVDRIRNVAFIGPSGSGKTLLLERLLHTAGALPAMGSVEKGTTISDFEPLEKQRGHSVYPSLVTFEHADRLFHLFDTPGHPDLRGEALGVLEAVDTVVLVVDPRTGVHPTSLRVFAAAGERGIDRAVVINKVDRPADLQRTLGDLGRALGNACLPLNLPAGGASRVVDCYFAPRGEPTDFSSVADAHRALVERVVEVDERLLERYLESKKELRPEELHEPLEKALRDGHLIPVAFTSATTGAGAAELLRVIAEVFPSPLEGTPPQFFMGARGTTQALAPSFEPGAHTIAHVFRVSTQAYTGALALVRVHQGALEKGMSVYVGSARKPWRIAHMFRVSGKQHTEVNRAVLGDIVALSKADELGFDDVLHDAPEDADLHMRPIAFPAPMYGFALVPKRAGDEQKLSDALRKLLAEDRCLAVEHTTASHELVLRGLGELHLRIALEELASRFHVDVDAKPQRIAYRETVTAPAEGHHRHKKQTGGAGQFGEVFLRIEPLPRDAGFEFVDAVKGGTIPHQYIPAVEKGVRQVLTSGCFAGYPLHDVRCIVHDGKHHPVDSKEVAFVAAGRKAFMDAVAKASPVLLEPIVSLALVVPDSAVGAVSGDIAARRGHITGSESQGDGAVLVHANAPLAELGDLEPRLRSLTAGQGSFSMELSHYHPAPPETQRKLAEAYRPHSDD